MQGCASPGSSVTQVVHVETPGCAGASCELRNDRGSWHLASTPGTVTLTTSDSPLQLDCRAEGGALSGTSAPASSPPMTAAGAVAGGVVGGAATGAVFGTVALAFIPVLGVLVLASGAVAGAAAGQAVQSRGRALSYPELISVPMTCEARDTQVASTGAPADSLGFEVRGLSTTQAGEAGLGQRSAVLVMSVADNGRAAAAGLRSGDIVLSADGHDLNDAAALEEHVMALAPGASLKVQVWREGQLLVLILTRAVVGAR